MINNQLLTASVTKLCGHYTAVELYTPVTFPNATYLQPTPCFWAWFHSLCTTQEASVLPGNHKLRQFQKAQRPI